MTEGLNNGGSTSLPRRRAWRWFVQFNLRTLLLLVTAAAVGCWWFLQPQTREEQLEGTPLRISRQVRVAKYAKTDSLPPGEMQVGRGGEFFHVVNDGRCRLYDMRGNLLVDGWYKTDLAHGKWTIYHTNGRKATEGVLTEGKKVGLWKTWDEEGQLIGNARYAEGKQEDGRWDEVPRLPDWGRIPRWE